MRKVVRYVTLALLLLGSIGEANANAKGVVQSSRYRHRIGFGLGLEYVNLEAKMKDDFSPFGTNFQGSRTQTKKKLQVAPSIELGVNIDSDYYLGMLLSWRYLNAKTKSRAPLKGMTHFSHEFKMDHYSDVLFKPGYKFIPNAMFYGLIGLSVAKWSHITDQFSEGVQDDTFKMNKTSIGLGVGFGLEYVLKERYAFSVDYIHHVHNSTTKKQRMTFIDNIAGIGPVPRTGDVSKKIEPSYATVAVRLSYLL